MWGAFNDISSEIIKPKDVINTSDILCPQSFCCLCRIQLWLKKDFIVLTKSVPQLQMSVIFHTLPVNFTAISPPLNAPLSR